MIGAIGAIAATADAGGSIAFAAHVIGFVLGAIGVMAFKKRERRLQ